MSAPKYSTSPDTLQQVVKLVLEGHTREQAASLAGASLNTVKFWAKRGLIPSRPQVAQVRVKGRARGKRSPKRIRDPRTRPSVGAIQVDHFLLGDRLLHKQVARLILSPEERPQELDPADLRLLQAVQEAGPAGLLLRDAIYLFPKESRRDLFHASLHRILRRARGCCLPCSEVITMEQRGNEYYYVAGNRIDLVARQEAREPVTTAENKLSLVEQILQLRRTSPQADAYQIAEQLGLTDSLNDQLRFSAALHAAYQATEQMDDDPRLSIPTQNEPVVAAYQARGS